MNDTVQQEEESMEDILSSIRSTVEEEVSKNGEDVQPEEEAAAAPENEEGTDDMTSEAVDEILDLTDIVEEVEGEVAADAAPATNAEEHAVESDLVDIDKFSETGEVAPADEADVAAARETYTEDGEEVAVEEVAAKEEVATEETPAEAVADTEDDIDVDVDDLMAEMAEDGELPTSETVEMPSEEDAAEAIAQIAEGEEAPAEEATEEVNVDDIMAEAAPEAAAEEPAAEEVAVEEAPAEETPAEEAAAEEAPAEEVAAEPAPTTDAAVDAVTEQVVEEAARKVRLSTTPSAQGLQVTFPVEVLAEALRPLVKDWVNENLPDIVQRLVREEFSRLADK